ncbi:hypothetical protein FFLO_02179 [Filobasidium floriforme]|uniref:Methyltransferase-domain-containing protein n=1 Tax=Filobasidium floriforme TaxID=5210 RepID=A0A8K0NS10_9TREE|nr:uncharacterized protein HD553DRAFT_348287 [Filobasidium floriforme]KAG7562399.1 hypothetical protein FFLO_02179 [Filobasidium floriforme]KAH8088428.1 hypothetical protein HD553DRAFT_348287 [Filobasidium floriforme]
MTHQSGLQNLRKQYLSLYPPHLIQLDLEPRLTLARNQGWIYDHLLSSDSLAAQYPPASDYQRKFWKLLVAALDVELRDDRAVEEELELDDRIAEHYTELIFQSTNPLDVPGPSYKTYIYNTSPYSAGSNFVPPSEEKAITLLEAQTTIEAGSTGLRTWTASLHLATLLSLDDSLLDPPFPPIGAPSGSSTPSSRPTGRTNLLELGAGTGFLSCFLAQTGRRTIWATDIGDEDGGDLNNEEESEERGRLEKGGGRIQEDRVDGLRRGPLKSLKSNLRINRQRFHSESRVIPRSLDWFDSVPPNDDSAQSAAEPYEAACAFSKSLPTDLVLLAADVIYDPDLVAPLVATLKMFLSQTDDEVGLTKKRFGLLAATVRNQETTDLFERECERTGLKVHVVRSPILPDSAATPMFWNASTWEGQDVKVVKIYV